MAGGGGGPAEKPWILVFDMDDTITRGKHNYNRPVYDVLAKAIRQRGNTVKYIFLLTNNDNRSGQIDIVITRLLGTYLDPKPIIFDAIKYVKKNYKDTPTELVIENILGIRATTKRDYPYNKAFKNYAYYEALKEYNDDEALKNLNDIADLISICGEAIDYTDIFKKYKVMFFDDMHYHILAHELNAANDKSQYRYVQVYPQKKPQDFSEELALLDPDVTPSPASKTRKQSGGSRKNKTKILKKSKKNKRK